MFKIAAFISFGDNFNSRVLKLKKKVKNKYGNQIYLNHPVHLTLFTLKIKKISSLKKIYIKKSNNNKILKLNINSTGVFYDDPFTNGHTLFYNLTKNKFLKYIQIKHLKFINDNIYVSKKPQNNIKNHVLRKNYKKFGFPFAGKIWKPHVTVASINKIKKNSTFIKSFLKQKINHKCNIKNIEFYRVSGDNHIFLFSTQIF